MTGGARITLAGLIASLAVAIMSAAAAPSDASGGEHRPADRQAALATFAGGCFWCMEPPFDEVPGVISTTAGYAGGAEPNPSYAEVAGGRTGHAEVVQVAYDPAEVSYEALLEIFWRNIDPFAVDRQFCDTGPQYRSAIFYHDEQQRAAAQASVEKVSARFTKPLATRVHPVGDTFHAAEDYHQDYYLKNPLRYRYYRFSCGRDRRLEQIWGSSEQ